MPSTVLIEVQIEVTCQRMEHFDCFIKTYWESTIYDPSNVKTTRHMECWGKYDAVSWISPDDHHKVACWPVRVFK